MGGIGMKKQEPWLNTFTYIVTYLFRYNTDVTSLWSGTVIKGVLLYVSNYVTKMPLKTHVIFDAIHSIFFLNPKMMGSSESCKNKAHKQMTKIVNSLSAKMEMGNVMSCMYLLGNPDHYSNFRFQPFYWQNFVSHVMEVQNHGCRSSPKRTAMWKQLLIRLPFSGIMGGLSGFHLFTTTFFVWKNGSHVPSWLGVKMWMWEAPTSKKSVISEVQSDMVNDDEDAECTHNAEQAKEPSLSPLLL